MTAIRSRIYPPLRDLIASRMPKLDRALGPLGLNSVRLVFNAMTGLEIMGSEPIGHSSFCVYLDLLEQGAAGKLQEAIQNGLWAIRKIRAPRAPANARVLVSRNRREGSDPARKNRRRARVIWRQSYTFGYNAPPPRDPGGTTRRN
jgi:hypothetical protein